ncbi:MAG: phage virion morphogenesis protein [Methylobacter sp.]|uniref:phage virion morphogenesis protein n=1 Tax=Methylobacter sp. TaxID=2051955 RepID=UPI0025F3452E|nr:phage virion morphogenesis protein [Methylobacter sp.]MCK9622007.1 phage virion morphogenesis protein [Methylobacter sp.]
MIEVEFDGRRIQAALGGLQRAVGNLSPALRSIGEELKESTHKRFVSQTAPDGQRWAPNSTVTIERKGHSKPLTGTTGQLGDSINTRMIGNDAVEIYSPMEYAAMQQFGGTKAEFPHLWGDIPARPFFGISNEDEANILDIIREHLESSL